MSAGLLDNEMSYIVELEVPSFEIGVLVGELLVSQDGTISAVYGRRRLP